MYTCEIEENMPVCEDIGCDTFLNSNIVAAIYNLLTTLSLWALLTCRMNPRIQARLHQ